MGHDPTQCRRGVYGETVSQPTIKHCLLCKFNLKCFAKLQVEFKMNFISRTSESLRSAEFQQTVYLGSGPRPPSEAFCVHNGPESTSFARRLRAIR